MADWDEYELERARQKALRIAADYGQTDGAHHKMWVIDQMVRALCEPDSDYHHWTGSQEGGWDEGIPP